MKRRTTLGAAVGSLVAAVGLGSANTSTATTSSTDRRNIPNPVAISEEAVRKARTKAKGERSEAAQIAGNGVSQQVQQKHSQSKKFLNQSRSVSNNWAALRLARKASVYASFVKAEKMATQGDLSEEDVLSAQSRVQSRVDTKIRATRSEANSDEALVVLGEVHRSLIAADNHLNNLDRLLESESRSPEVNISQAYGSVQGALMNLADADQILAANRSAVNGNGNSTPSVSLGSLREELQSTLNSISTSSSSFASVAVEAPEGFLSKAEGYDGHGLTAGSTMATLEGLSLAESVTRAEELPNPWESSETVNLEDVRDDKEAAESAIDSRYDGPGDQLKQSILASAQDEVVSGDSLLARAENRENPEESDSLVIANAHYRMAAGIAESTDRHFQ